MLRALKKIVPLSARTRLKWLGYAAQDMVGGKRPPRVPPRRKTFIGGHAHLLIILIAGAMTALILINQE